MKHLLEYTKYNTTNTSMSDDVDFVYNDNINLSKLIQNTISFINDNYNKISDIKELSSNYPTIDFSNTIFTKLIIRWDSKIPKLQFQINKNYAPNSPEYQTYPITSDEYDYLKTFFIETKRRKDIDITKNYDAADLIDPLKIASDKYNL